MGKLTLQSTFKDIRDLLENKDELFCKQCEYLCGDKFKNETDKGYLIQNFHFFMAIVLGGVSYRELYQKNFLNLAYPNRKDQNTTSSWEQGEINFIFGKREIIGNDFKDAIKEMDENKPLSIFYDGTWLDEKDRKGNFIFKDSNGNFIFVERNNIPGDERAKEKMKQIVDFLVNGIQITSNGGFLFMADPYTLLLSNKQLIMNGAPGTGKTYSAMNDIADKLFGIESKSDSEKVEIKKIRMDMVQFHPSYDYTDFIEGIRPNLSGQNVGYTLKNGSFKRFCRRAGVIERILSSGQSVDESTVEQFLEGEDELIKEF